MWQQKIQTLWTGLSPRKVLSRTRPRLERFAHSLLTAGADVPDGELEQAGRDLTVGPSLCACSCFVHLFCCQRGAVVEDEGIEPSTLGLQSQCSPAELIPQLRALQPSRPLKTK